MAKNINEPSKFTETVLKNVAKNLQDGMYATSGRLTISDDIVTGLRAVVYKSGLITLAASYHYGDERPLLKLGSLNKDADDHISLADAREITKTVKALADKGIDPQAGLHKRLTRELLEQGTKWRPR